MPEATETQPERSKLQIVRQSLETNPEVVMVDTREGRTLPYTRGHSVVHTVDFFVAPKTRTYDVEALNRFFESLVPNLKASYKDPFSKLSENLFHCHTSEIRSMAYAIYSEIIGTETNKKVITLKHKDIPRLEGFDDGQFEETGSFSLRREIKIHAYPGARIARVFLSGGFDPHRIHAGSVDLRDLIRDQGATETVPK